MTKQAPFVDHLSLAMGGEFALTVHRMTTDTWEFYNTHNLIVDLGIRHLGDILTAAESTDIDLGFIEPGSGTTAPDLSDTDTETPITPADRLATTLQSRATVSPFEITLETFIGSSKYTRPFTINEMCVFFTPDETGDLFARGKLDTPVTITGTDTVTISYAFLFR